MAAKTLNKALIQRLHTVATIASRVIERATPKDKDRLEDVWDIEHAYYSSALEGSKIDRKEFEALAKQTQ